MLASVTTNFVPVMVKLPSEFQVTPLSVTPLGGTVWLTETEPTLLVPLKML